MKPLFERAVIAGVGLIGGSLALAGKRNGLFKTTIGVGRSSETLNKAKQIGLVDEIATDHVVAAEGADIFFAAAPAESIVSLCLAIAPHLPAGCVVTDCGSVKSEIVKNLEASLPKTLRFVGGHPVAGTEMSGPEAARADLFENRFAIITPTGNTDPLVIDLVSKMWEGVGSTVVTMKPEDHDKALAVISHLPHLAAYALVETMDEMDSRIPIRRFAAGGFKDITRIAASDPAMWRDIFRMNKKNLLETIEKFEARLARYKQAIENNDFDLVEKMLQNVKTIRLGIDEK